MGKGKSVFNTRTSHITKINTPDTVTKTSNFQGERVSNVTSHKIIRPTSAIQESTIVSSGSNNFGEIPLAYGETEVEKTVDPHTFNFDNIGKNSVFSGYGDITHQVEEREIIVAANAELTKHEKKRLEEEKIYGDGIRDSSQFDGYKFEALTTQTPSSGVAPDKIEPYKLKENVLATGDFNTFTTNKPLTATQQAMKDNQEANPEKWKSLGDLGAWSVIPQTSNTFSVSGTGDNSVSSHGKVQTQYNKQQLSNELNSDLKFWQNNFVNQYGKEDAPTRDEAQAWVNERKESVKNRENTGGYNAGGFEHEYLSELDSRMNNLYSIGGSPTTTSNNGKNNKTGKITNSSTTWKNLMDPNFSV
jgi:hypothetical protein